MLQKEDVVGMATATNKRANRSVLVTGASTGLGRDIAVLLAERGFDVYASMRDLSRRGGLDAAAAQRNVRLTVLQLDVTDPASIDTAVSQIIDQSGGIFGMVNSAGVGLGGYFEDLLDEEVRKVLEVNLFGSMAVTRAVLPAMRAAGRGRIVLISSVCGRVGTIAASAYAVSKFGLSGFGESLAPEVEPFGIRVALIEPGAVNTELWSTHRVIAKRAQDPASPYSLWFEAGERLAERVLATTPTQSRDVANSVYKALTRPRPPVHQVVGWRAGMVAKLRRYLPEPWFERLYFGTTVRQITRNAPPVQHASSPHQ